MCAAPPPAFRTPTGSIALLPGSVLDVSSGGYLRPDGTLAVDAFGAPLGRGGDISISTYGGVMAGAMSPDVYLKATPDVRQHLLGGTLLGYGFYWRRHPVAAGA